MASSLLGRYRQLAPTASVRVSPLCLGAMTFGVSQRSRYGEITKETAFDILDHFYNNGGNFIDTSNTYHNGESEMWLGEWMNSRKNRDEIILATKYTAPYNSDAKIRANVGGNSSKSMRISIESSLNRLQTTYIDLFYVHWWDHTTSIPELMRSLNDLVTSGKVIYLGISDTPAWIVSKANQYARDHGLRQFSVYQGFWNAGLRDFERDIIPMAIDEGMALCPYGTIGQGRFQTEAVYKEREEHNPGRNFIPLSDHDKRVSKKLEMVAQAKGVVLHNIALAYVFHKAPYVFPIVGSRKVEHIKGNIEALAVRLSDQDIAEIESAYDFDHGFPQTFLSNTLFNHEKSQPANHPLENRMNKVFGNIDWVEPVKPMEIAQRQ
ncbi:hypothetical protein LTR47_008517 [Exophiala xenobiotica]|nr:hypothetical protein LTR92_001955 [Exophiala xenobiotica]KAK5204290.1 hypothetical protein LTR41_010024 [Exophiala xenobiotica]KAK5227710.1 hypothetical protein LTR47_008517 [Exophiala xenobiotica]KAK5228738.1 hypothetical protein LTR72_002625 [Exophiala xenobiotica]KAK5246094.1 hypothetical protein LTS06_008558 [Exophiala xenobiotica]